MSIALPAHTRGDLSHLLLADLLQTLEAGGRCGEVRVRTEVGAARIWFRGGCIIDAELGNLRGEAAALELFGLTEGRIEVEYKPVDRFQVIHATTLSLLAKRRSRRALCGARPRATLRRAELASSVRCTVPAGPRAASSQREPPIRLLQRKRQDPGPPPFTLGRYEVLCPIARGGMGMVYLCRAAGCGGFSRSFALKVLREHLGDDPEGNRRFVEEARIAGRLHHPNAVGVLDVGTHGGKHYLVMDYVEGCTFDDLLRKCPHGLSPRTIVSIVIDALNGLHAAHTLTDDDGTPLELVHCDVSPHNMLVGADGACRISDFGIARIARRSPGGARGRAPGSLGGEGATRGKPGYLSPEQVVGGSVDCRSDVFAMGVVLWNALTGERLFDGASIGETLQHVVKKPIPPPSSVGRRPPASLDAICLKALQRVPEARFQSAEALLVALRRVAAEEDVLAPPSEVAHAVWAACQQDLLAQRSALLRASNRASGRAETELALARSRWRPQEPETAGEDTLVEADAVSRTLPLARSSRRRVLLVAAALLALLALIAALVWPAGVGRLFKVGTPWTAGAGDARRPSSPPKAKPRHPSGSQDGPPSVVEGDRSGAAAQ